MPLLGGLLVSLFSGLTTWLATWMTRKLAVSIAAVATLGTIIGVLLVALRTAVATLVQVVPADSFLMSGLGMVFPPIASACITTLGTIWAATVLYAWQRDALDIYVRAG